MSDPIHPTDYYAQVLPAQYAAALVDAPDNVLEQPELTGTYVIEGESGGTFGLRAQGQALEFVPGGISNPDMHTTISLADWRSSVANGSTEVLVDYVRRRKITIVKALKGTVKLELTRSDESVFESTTVFGGQAEPRVILRAKTSDYAAMLRGELDGQMAFLIGRLKFEGSLPLLMQIGALSG